MKNNSNQNKWHARYFRSLDQVEEVFNLPLTDEQQEMIISYLKAGVRPDPQGCWTCSPAVMRVLTGSIDQYENAVDAGIETWPYK